METKGDKTDMTLKSQDNKVTLALAVPAQQIQKADVRLNQIVTAKRLGQRSFTLACNGTPLGVVADKQASMIHSKKIN